MNSALIVLIFALAHAAAVTLGLVVDFDAEFILTMLTLTMSLILSDKKNMPVSIMIVLAVLVNLCGMYLGDFILKVVRKVVAFESPYRKFVRGPVSTFTTTCILGYVQLGVSAAINKWFHPKRREESREVWLVVAICAVLVVRMVLQVIRHGESMLSNVYLNFIVNYTCTIAVVVYLVICAKRYRNKAEEAKIRSHLAEYNYLKLKQQIDPHFLFNGLNSLQGLIEEGDNQAAIAFNQKLANIYRHMLESEGDCLSTLGDEIKFASMYTDLIRSRFQEGLEMNIDIPEDCLNSCYVVPCSIQLLIENATKHNVISTDTPLVVSVTTDGKHITVSNNVNQKITSLPSPGLGLKYIQSQCHDLMQEEVIIEKTSDRFTVRLPIIRQQL